MKRPMEEDLTQKKLSSLFKDNLKLQKMQFVSLHSDLKTVMDDIDTVKNQTERLFDDRLPTMIMLTMNKKLPEESQLGDMISKVEDKVTAIDTTFHTLVESSVQTKNLIQNLLKAQNQTLHDNKKGENVESSTKPPTQNQEEEAISNAASKKRRISTQSQRDMEKKKAKRETTE